MIRKALPALIVLVTTSLVACKKTPEAASTPAPSVPSPTSFLNSLSSDIGVSPQQANAGLGSVLAYAQEKLPAADYAKVASSIPGASNYVNSAKSMGAVTGNPMGSINGLSSSLAKLGISPDQATKMIPKVTEYVGKAGGPQVASLMKGLFPVPGM